MKRGLVFLFLLVSVIFVIEFISASPADLNSDNKVNATDIQLIIRWILGIDQSNNATDMDGNGQVNIFDLVNASRLFGKIYGSDSTAPTIISSSPSANLSSGVTSTILFAKTDERATCKYLNTTGGNYSVNMTTFTRTGGVSHSTTLTGLANGTLYNYYVQCQDEAGNINSTNYNISFGVNGSVTPVFQDDFERDSPIGKTQAGVTTTASVEGPSISTAIAHSGTRSARFEQGWQEGVTDVQLNFGGLANLSEVWLEFYLYMPDGTENPSIGPAYTKQFYQSSSNDKFFRLWGTTYADVGSKVGASIWASTPPDGWGRTAIDWGETGWTGGAVGPSHEGYDPATGPFYAFPTAVHLGTWLRIRLHGKVATGLGSNDGVVQMWVDDTYILNLTNLYNYPTNGYHNYYTNGYLLGSGNNFALGQMIYLDDFKIYSENPGW